MLTTIDADCILANLLQSRSEVTLRKLNSVRIDIQAQVPSVYVDVSKNCVIWSIHQRPDMFDWTDQSIRRCSEWSKSFVDEFFNWRIPAEIRASVLAILRTD